MAHRVDEFVSEQGIIGVACESDDPTEHWVIMGCTGDYEDVYRYPVAVVSSEEEATSLVQAFTERLDRYQQLPLRDTYYYYVEGPLSSSVVFIFGTDEVVEDAYFAQLEEGERWDAWYE